MLLQHPQPQVFRYHTVEFISSAGLPNTWTGNTAAIRRPLSLLITKPSCVLAPCQGVSRAADTYPVHWARCPRNGNSSQMRNGIGRCTKLSGGSKTSSSVPLPRDGGQGVKQLFRYSRLQHAQPSDVAELLLEAVHQRPAVKTQPLSKQSLTYSQAFVPLNRGVVRLLP